MAQEIERKFLVDDISKIDLTKHEGVRIEQGFLSSVPERVVRVRIKGDHGYLTVKGKSNDAGTSRYEFETEIPVSDAEDLLAICEPGRIEKQRHEIFVNGQMFELDIFTGKNSGLIICEIELISENQSFERPDWLDREITGDIRFYNNNIAKHPFSENPEYYKVS